MPKLADFGLAFRTPPIDPSNPHFYNDSEGSHGFRPPEQFRWVDPGTMTPVDECRLNSKTNVFGVGCILYCLVTLRDRPPVPAWLGNGNLDQTLAIPIGWPAGQYSWPLHRFIGDCLRFRQNNRPSFAALLQRINTHTGGNPGGVDRSLGMRSGTAAPAVAQAQQLLPPADLYRLCMHRGMLPE